MLCVFCSTGRTDVTDFMALAMASCDRTVCRSKIDMLLVRGGSTKESYQDVRG
jgi:hypothetical protein